MPYCGRTVDERACGMAIHERLLICPVMPKSPEALVWIRRGILTNNRSLSSVMQVKNRMVGRRNLLSNSAEFSFVIPKWDSKSVAMPVKTGLKPLNVPWVHAPKLASFSSTSGNLLIQSIPHSMADASIDSGHSKSTGPLFMRLIVFSTSGSVYDGPSTLSVWPLPRRAYFSRMEQAICIRCSEILSGLAFMSKRSNSMYFLFTPRIDSGKGVLMRSWLELLTGRSTQDMTLFPPWPCIFSFSVSMTREFMSPDARTVKADM